MEHYKTYLLADWLSYLGEKKYNVAKVGLDRIQEVAARMAVNSFSIPVITVGGTNGKGSTVATMESILLANQYRVGAVCSPHLLHYNERIRLQGKSVSDALLCEAFCAIEDHRKDIALSYFEYNVLASLYIFKKTPLDFILLEIGLGGRLDAFNIVEPDVAIVTTVDLDHESFLGDTREKIAYEKAGIYRSQKPAICGDKDTPQSLLHHAAKINAPLIVYEKDFFSIDKENHWEFQGMGKVFKHLPKPHILLKNAALGIAGLLHLGERCPLNEEAIAEGLKNIRVPGRYEKISETPEVIVDVAHNPQSTGLLARRLSTQLPENPQAKTLGVFSILRTKDAINSIFCCKDVIHEWFISEIEDPLATPLESLQEVFQTLNITAVKSFPSLKKAYEAAQNAALPTDRIIVFGSFHTVAAVLRTHGGEP